MDKITGRNHLIYPSFQTHYWFRTIFPRFSNFEVRGAKNWMGFYASVFARKMWRNKWIISGLSVLFAWYVNRNKVAAALREQVFA